MARSQTNEREYDTIDLTLSSPEPEPQPRPTQHIRAPLRQTQLYFGHQPAYYTMPSVKSESSQPATLFRAPAAAQQTRLIHPTHLREIISTTSPYALQQVLLELCQISPAFSGALVRGLAPHSTCAQTIMNQLRINHERSHAGARNPNDSDDAYEKMKKKLARPNPPSLYSNRPSEPAIESRGGQPRQESYASQTISQVKHEPGTPSTPSSDGELRRPGPSSQKVRRPMASSTPSYIRPEGSSALDRKPNISVKAEPTSASSAKICTRCHEPFLNSSAPCLYHPGRTVKQEDRSVVWSCCEEDILSAGCDFRPRHTAIDDDIEDTVMQRKRPSVSPAPESARLKKPRAL
ncbi:hypothetical protein ACJQWK_00836 [Exserohilum turcicum]